MKSLLSKSDTKRDKQLVLLYLIPNYTSFVSHRLHLALAAKQAGFTVLVATRGSAIKQISGIEIIELKYFNRGININIIKELLSIWELYQLYKVHKPDIVHHVTLKPILYGALAAKLSGIKTVIHAVAGLGRIFINDKKINILRPIICLVMRVLLAKSTIIFQNKNDLQVLQQYKCINNNNKIALIRGAGVDVNLFSYAAEPIDRLITIVLASRMLWPKGIKELLAAAKILKLKYQDKISFILYGEPDPYNPDSVPKSFLADLNKHNIVSWQGYGNNMQVVYHAAHIVVLPSFYGEGLPKTLLEAASCGRPIVTTNIPGCNDIVQHEVNGLLVEPQNTSELINALDKLISDKDLRIKLGQNGRQRVLDHFSEAIVQQQTLELYNA